jgi:hypothetical protein
MEAVVAVSTVSAREIMVLVAAVEESIRGITLC